jgi:hypothetical protein
MLKMKKSELLMKPSLGTLLIRNMNEKIDDSD